jgi:hypothetical protein
LDEEGIFADPGQDADQLYRTVYKDLGGITQLAERKERPNHRRTRVWYGPIGSGDILMKDAKMRDELRDKYKIIGLEMEAAGIGNTIPVGVVRGVCDYADEYKNDDWHSYAAAVAAAYAKAILYEIKPHARTNSGKAVDAGFSTESKGKQVEVDNQVKQPFQSTLPNYSNHMFSGRDIELTWIQKIMQKSPELHQRICLYGLGSIG